jgi:hypothetical protein
MLLMMLMRMITMSMRMMMSRTTVMMLMCDEAVAAASDNDDSDSDCDGGGDDNDVIMEMMPTMIIDSYDADFECNVATKTNGGNDKDNDSNDNCKYDGEENDKNERKRKHHPRAGQNMDPAPCIPVHLFLDYLAAGLSPFDMSPLVFSDVNEVDFVPRFAHGV